MQEKDYFWQVQGLTSFCKAKNDWIDFERIHLSFVKHEGKETKYKQVCAIEGAIKIHGTNGALALSQLILSGEIKTMATQSIEMAKKLNQQFPQSIFASMGGTSAKRSKTGTCMFRQFSLYAGYKSDFVLQMAEAEGEETATGGIQRKKSSVLNTISVPISYFDLLDFAHSIQMEWSAYRTSVLMQDKNQKILDSQKQLQEDTPKQEILPDIAPKDTQAVVNKDAQVESTVDFNRIYCIFWQVSENERFSPMIVPVQESEHTLKNLTMQFLKIEGKEYVADANLFSSILSAIRSAKKQINTKIEYFVSYTNKENIKDTILLGVKFQYLK